MALSIKHSEVICFYDLQYRWTKRSTQNFVEVCVELNELPEGQMLVAICPRVFRPDMVEEVIEEARKLGWKPETVAEPFNVRLTKRGVTLERV